MSNRIPLPIHPDPFPILLWGRYPRMKSFLFQIPSAEEELLMALQNHLWFGAAAGESSEDTIRVHN